MTDFSPISNMNNFISTSGTNHLNATNAGMSNALSGANDLLSDMLALSILHAPEKLEKNLEDKDPVALAIAIYALAAFNASNNLDTSSAIAPSNSINI
jgi:hypothetical protein